MNSLLYCGVPRNIFNHSYQRCFAIPTVWVKTDIAKAMTLKKTFGQHLAKTCFWAYADNEGPDQPARPYSLMSAFNVH